MKKIITTLLFFAALPIFAQSEKGYRNTNWNDTYSEVKNKKGLTWNDDHLEESCFILGQQTSFNYYFVSNQLKAIAYTIDSSEELILKIINTVKEKYKDPKFIYYDLFKDAPRYITEEEKLKAKQGLIKQAGSLEFAYSSDAYRYMNGADTISAAFLATENYTPTEEKKFPGFIYAKVNQNTSVFFYINQLYENKIVAVYCGIPEDNF